MKPRPLDGMALMTPDVDLRAEFDRLGLSMTAGARMIGVSPRTVRRWVDGSRDTPEMALRLLKVLDLPGVRERLTHFSTP